MLIVGGNKADDRITVVSKFLRRSAMDVEKICRTCLGLSGPLLSIYDGTGGGGEGCIADMLRDFTKTKPQPADSLPQKVCLSCISEINRCYSFKLKCENSNRTLRQLLPDALPEEPDKSGKPPIVQADKCVQTSEPESKAVQTQTQVHEMTQTAQTANADKTATPATPERDSKLCVTRKKVKLDKEMASSLPAQFVEYRARRGRRHVATVKRKRSESLDVMDLPNGSEIIMEVHADEMDTEACVGVPDGDAGTTVYAALRAEQLDANEHTTYYELSSAKIDYVEEDTMPKHDAAASAAELVSYDNSPEQQERADDEADADVEEAYTQLIYDEEVGSAEDTTQQDAEQTDYFIYNNENGEAEIVAKRMAVPQSGADKGQTASGKREQKCTECVMTFVSAKNLKRHMLKRHGRSADETLQSGSVKTQLSDSATTNAQAVVVTTTTTQESGTTTMSCASGNVSAPPQPIVTTTTPAQLSFFCDRCNAGFALQKSLVYHRKLNACTAPTYSCDECDRVFVSAETLSEHKATHLLGNACSECNRAFESKDELSEHLIAEHKRKQRNQCCVCKKVFTMLSALKDHMRVHSGEKPYLCPLCGKAFSQNANLKQHVMRHSKEKKFKCDDCANSYVTKAELFSHKRTHTGDQPFKCEYCSASFTTSSSLVKHKRKHTGERPYACDICPMRFTALNVLKNHRRTHTGEKPFKCFYCNKGFTQKGDCQIHQRTHSDRNYACYCGDKFANLAKLRTHMKTHNGADTQRRRAVSADGHADEAQAVHITIVDVEDEDGGDDGADAEETPEGQLAAADGADGEEFLHVTMEQM